MTVTSDHHAKLLHRANRALPAVRGWVQQLVAEHTDAAQPVASLRYPRLPAYFPEPFLATTRVVLAGRIVVPPFAAVGMPELSALEQMPFTGVTYAGTIFMHREAASEATIFHELVHVVQWKTLGVDDFILAYGMGLIQHGYAKNPFEAVAFDLQSQFDRDVPIADIAGTVAAHARRTREWAADEFRRNGVVMGAESTS